MLPRKPWIMIDPEDAAAHNESKKMLLVMPRGVIF